METIFPTTKKGVEKRKLTEFNKIRAYFREDTLKGGHILRDIGVNAS